MAVASGLVGPVLAGPLSRLAMNRKWSLIRLEINWKWSSPICMRARKIEMATTAAVPAVDVPDKPHQPLTSLQSLLSKACKQENLVSDLDVICEFYRRNLSSACPTSNFRLHYQQVRGQTGEDTSPNLSIFDIKSYFLSLFFWATVLAAQVKRLAQLMLVANASHKCFI